MPSNKIDSPTLASTIARRSTALPGDALSLFRTYIREKHDDNDCDDGGPKGDAERDLDFVLATGHLDSMDEENIKEWIVWLSSHAMLTETLGRESGDAQLFTDHYA